MRVLGVLAAICISLPSFLSPSFLFLFSFLFAPFPSAPRSEPSDLIRWPFLHWSDEELAGTESPANEAVPWAFALRHQERSTFTTESIDGEDAVSFELPGASNHYLKRDNPGEPNQEMGGNGMTLMVSVPVALVRHWLPRHPRALNQ